MFIEKNIRLLTWFNFFLDFRLYSPIAILYFVQVTGSFALGLIIFSIAAIASSAFELPTGIVSDLLGRKKTIIFGSLTSVLSLIFYAIGGSFWLLIIGSVFAGLSMALFSGNNDAFLHDTLSQGNRQKEFPKFFGKVSSMFQVGLAVSAFIGGFIAEVSLVFVMWISVIPQIIGLLLAFKMVEPEKRCTDISTNIFEHLREAIVRFKNNNRLKTLSLASILSYGIGETIHEFQPIFIAMLWPTWAIGVARSLTHAFAFSGFWFAGKIINKLSVLKSLLISEISCRFFGIVANGFPTIISPILISVSDFFFGISTVSQNTLLQKEFTEKQRATMGSLNALFGSIFFAVFAFLFGLLADDIGPVKSLLIGQLLLFSVVFLYWRLFKEKKD